MAEDKHRAFVPELAPSELAAEQPSFARLAGSLGLGLAVVGTLAVWMNVSKPRLIGPTTAIFLTLIGAAAMLYHAARDSDRLVRRSYIIFGIVALGIGAALSVLKQPTMGEWFLPWGVIGLFGGLFFLMAAGRNEHDAPVPNIIAGLLALLGFCGTVTGLIGVGCFSQEYLPRLAGVGIVGMIFWWAAVGQLDSASDRGHRFAQLLGIIAAIALAYGLGRSIVASFGTERFLVPRGLVLSFLGLVGIVLAFGLSSDRAIVAMTRRELGAYFCTPIAYLVLFGNTFIGWINYLMFVNDYLFDRSGQQALPEPIVQNYLVTFFPVIVPMIVVPIITMRIISEERRSGTVEVLMTAPVGEWQVVLSKFIAALIYFLVLFLPWGLFLIPVYYMGREGFDYAPLLGYLLALVCTGAAFVATGLFCSSLTKNQIIAAVLAFAAMMLYFVLPFAMQWVGAGSTLRSTIMQLSYMQVWNSSIGGSLSMQQLFTYLSITVFWLFLTTKVLEARKWS
jgi:ABC-2 type transport system permease protein